MLRYSLSTLAVAGLLVAQGHEGGHHGLTPTQASRPIAPASIGLQQQAAGYSGINNQRVILPPPIGLQWQAATYTGINPGAYSNSNHHGGQQPTRINRVIGGHENNRDRERRNGYALPYYPVFGYGNTWYDPSAYAPVEYTSGEQTAQVTANLLGEQIQRLTAEVQALRQAERPPLEAALPAGDPAPAVKPIILVLHGGKQLEVQNYAIMNGVLWDFSKENSRRIPLETVDGPASAKATEETGASFPAASFATNPN